MIVLNRVKIGISSCLLGESVRYDGTAKYQPLIVEMLAGRFELISLCPEVGIGQSVPRPPIQRVEVDGDVRLLRVEDPSFDLTEKMFKFAHQSVEQLSTFGGFIFKSRSPSCGLNDVKLFNETGEVIGQGKGAFSEVISKTLTEFPLADESDLTNQQEIEAFVKRVERYNASP